MNIHFDRIQQLRDVMSRNRYDAVIISGTDPHKSEYFAPRWKGVEWLSGFSGEAGDVVVTADHAGLWTDSRYFIQAVSELDGSGVELHKSLQGDMTAIPQWLAEHFAGRGALR
ncbi:MAG: aminopeptidase P family N-terminal domain-containing protein, partial [Bacteroidales bacterium]|nr:aminopeptidase P family N-terminal domain-containing protein [Bacteroidales bacterium]